MHIGKRVRFAYLLSSKRFAEALATVGEKDLSTARNAVWALFKLGCYRSAIALNRNPRTGREALALGTSLAACGDILGGCQVIRDAYSEGLLNSKLLNETACAIAQYSPTAALGLIERSPSAKPELLTALLVAHDRIDEAIVVVKKTLAENHGAVDPDIFLLKANLTADYALSLELMNEYLAAYGLSPVGTKDDLEAPSAANLTSTIKAGSIRGPLVTVTMPAYNTAKRIGASIESLLAQSYRDIEVLVVDDGSTDETVGIIRALAVRDSRVRLIERSENGGPYAARNMALANARGDFVTCHDSDDWAHPEKIHKQTAPLLRDPSLIFTLSNWARIQDDGLFYARQVYPLTRLNPASPLFRRTEVIDRAGFYDNVRTGADSEYIARLKLIFGRRGWRKLSEPLAFGAHRPNSLMTDSATGSARGKAMNVQRLEYWETWMNRHVNALRNRQSLYRPFETFNEDERLRAPSARE
ncbi:glycosyltransferase family 2 protein [Sinorhizobium medicae]|uniref:Glycosyltransferase n=1 Tax=Sinorhizobium medicae TaxID=110321 RepID=A0A6G1WJF1_9HYPH|nr:glycosyltransferase family A protein [Sinorhizobium medicae]MDX0498679.1 glycosyltransferase [Sinorhizobium medicae]MDX0549000.1 glycosyltransferase [Sinorhizobium medicae]MDX0555162.1 glycosyltransferase [Sinorhizobium medicae]MDX0573607.1 glycosyltransferase [Sinorhizobium medicae]MDX0672480.1 glycosyltransferase [Sinorhizobium medicae]